MRTATCSPLMYLGRINAERSWIDQRHTHRSNGWDCEGKCEREKSGWKEE